MNSGCVEMFKTSYRAYLLSGLCDSRIQCVNLEEMKLNQNLLLLAF